MVYADEPVPPSSSEIPFAARSEFAANTIAENIYFQVDEEGYRYQLIDSIIDHRKIGAALLANNGLGKTKTTKGCFMLERWH